MIRLIPLLGAGLGALVVGACAVADPPATQAPIPQTAAPEQTPTAGPLTSAPPRPVVFDLSETHILRGGFSIAHPAGWTVEPRGPYLTTITEMERDRDRGPLGPIDGYQVTFELLPAQNFATDLSAGGMLGLYKDKGFEVSGEREELSVFGAPALQLEGTFPTSGRAARCLMGVASEEEVFALCIGAPSPGEVDNFLPTWDRMLASITPVVTAPREFLLSEIRRIPSEDLTITHPSGWRATSHIADGRRHTAIVDPAAEYVISIYTRPASDDELRSKAAMAVGWRTDPIIQVPREV